MSAEEEIELKNLVAQTLENKGILPKIRAELRANVFLALEENPSTKETLLKNDELSAFVKIPIGSLILNLIREFLEVFELEFTLSVFDPETKYGKEYSSISKDIMMKELKITECDKRSPLLYKVIEGVINNNSDLKAIDSEKNFEDVGQGDISVSSDSTNLMPSPQVLNSTYVKEKSEDESFHPSSVKKAESKDDNNETIKEELMSNNISDSDSVTGPELNLEKTPRSENLDENLLSNSSPKDSKPNSLKAVPKAFEEIDLLTFTPIKETKSMDILQRALLPPDKEAKTDEKKESEKTMSVLGDLPPLTGVVEDRGDKINKIKAIMDKWPELETEEDFSADSKSNKDHVSEEKNLAQLKSDRSEHSLKSDKTETPDDFEEDISDLLNGHTPSEGQLTVDETISKVSCAADYLESI